MYIYINTILTLCPTKRYDRMLGLKFQTIKQQSIDPVAAITRQTYNDCQT